MKLFKKAKKGFTLVELIVVIAIVAILAAVSVAGYYGFIESAKQSAAEQEASQIKLVLQAACTPKSQTNYDLDGDGVVDTGESSNSTYVWSAEGLKVSLAAGVTNDQAVADFALILNFNGAKLATGASLTVKEGTKVTSSQTNYELITVVTYKAANLKSSDIKFVA